MRFQPVAHVIASVAFPAIAIAQGSLEPPPGDPAPTQKSLQEIWDRIDDVASRTGSMQESIDSLTARVAAQERLITQQAALIDMTADALDLPLPWTVFIADAPSEAPWGSFALTPDGHPAFAYRLAASPNDFLRYAEFDGTQWLYTDTPVDHSFSYLSLAFAPSDHPAVAYYNTTNNDLMFATFDGAIWQITTVEETGNVGRFASLAFGPDGQPGIAYYSQTGGDLKYAQLHGSTWHVSTVDSDGRVGQICSLNWTPDDRPAIAYRDDSLKLVKYAERNGTTWNTTEVTEAGKYPGYISLAFSPSGRPAIAYRVQPDFEPILATFDGSSWNIETVFPTTGNADGISLAFQPSGHPAISFFDSSSEALHYLAFDGSSWRDSIVEKTTGLVNLSAFSDLTFAPSGQAMIGFYYNIENHLKLAIRGTTLHP